MIPDPQPSPGYAYRVDFQFISADRQLLRSKTWQLSQGAQDPPRTLLLHVNARLLSRLPEFRELAQRHARFTFMVADLTGELVVQNFPGITSADALAEVISRHRITVGVTLKPSSLDFTLHVGQAQP